MNKGFLVYTLLISSLVINNSLFAAEDYLSSLEDESSKTQVDNAAEHTHLVKTKIHKALAGFTATKIPGNLNKNQFKVFLMDNRFDSYMSFLELDETKKDDIFKQYQESQIPDISAIEAQINRLLKQ